MTRGERLLSNVSHRLEENRKKPLSPMGGHFVAATGEFVGTFLFLWLAFAGHLMAVDQAPDTATTNKQTSSTTVVYISLAYGFSLLVTVWAFFRISGGLFNPAVRLSNAPGLPTARNWKMVTDANGNSR